MLAAMSLMFLTNLLEARGPAGFEGRAAKVFEAEAKTFADAVYQDHFGSVYAEINPSEEAPVLLSGHLDEIGLMVSHVSDLGLISFLPLGGWDSQVLVGQRIRLLTREGDLIGVIGKKPIHLMDAEERKKVSATEDLWIDLGLEVGQVRERVPVGTPGVIEQPVLVTGERVMSPGIDNRAGAYVVLEALRALKEAGVTRRVVAVASSQEEIGAHGARAAAHRLEPLLAIAVDVTFESTQPGVEPKRVGNATFGSGACLAASALVNPKVLSGLIEAAGRHGIPYTLSANPARTGTDADAIAPTRSGVPSAVVSVPNRYMHSPSEMIDLRDVRSCVDLIRHYVADLGQEDFLRPALQPG